MNFGEKLIDWYTKNKRDLPWRKTKDPYKIWLSEIILQQTRVDQGLDYYYKFVTHYPTVDLLAGAKEEEVLKLWQGLGYYSRARNLHYTAKYITEHFETIFPNDYAEIIKLKGVGEYTAAAISSFAFNQVYPVIDGNVYRVLTRIFGISDPIDSSKGKAKIKELAQELISHKAPGIYNQAIMEFGALQCTPKQPNCETCPFVLSCYAQTNQKINLLPVKEKKVKQQNRFLNYLVITTPNNATYVNQRTKKGIWQNLYDFPLIESKTSIKDFKELDCSTVFGDTLPVFIQKSQEYKHILSHQKIYATFWQVKIDSPLKNTKAFEETPIDEIQKYPVPKLIDNYIKSDL